MYIHDAGLAINTLTRMYPVVRKKLYVVVHYLCSTHYTGWNPLFTSNTHISVTHLSQHISDQE